MPDSQSPAAPPLPLGDRLRHALVPRGLYLWDKYRRELQRGEQEIRLIPFLAQPGRVSIDVGAHKGIYSYAMMQHSLAVHAFEPNPRMYGLLRSRVDGLGGKITTHQTALSNVTGTAELRVPKRGSRFDHPRATLAIAPTDDNFVTTVVKTYRFDDLDITNVGLMKIDVEGFEQQVLDGAAETIQRDKPNLIVEIEERHARAPLTDIVREVCSLGYACVVLRRGVLTPFSALDLMRDTVTPKSKKDYVNNFVFLPTGT